MNDKPTAPHDLDLVIDFVNTADLEAGKEALSDPAGLAGWLTARRLLGPGAKLRAAELESALRLREGLRTMMLAHNGGPAEEAGTVALEEAARRGELSVHFDRGVAYLAPRAGGLAGALGALLVPVAASMSDGTWQRAKACRAEDCHWAFYDFSRNRSATWCEMAVCGNREKVRSYRQRLPRAGRPQSA